MNFSSSGIPFGTIIAAVIICSFLYAFYYQWKVKRDGLEATAYVTWIERKESSDGDGGFNYYYDYHVAYTAQDGREYEGVLANGKSHLNEGDIILIRYLPGKEEHPVYIGMK
jgi:hypothetical protein